MSLSSLHKSLVQAASKVAEYAREGARRDGVPFFYRDQLGRLIKEYPDGRRMMIIQEGDGEKEILLGK